ncbi:MAG: hypothetical protein LIQ31_11185 [Planctomycetes bacterium]|nr:hypothetical protein [Planctomycetota bacterium]
MSETGTAKTTSAGTAVGEWLDTRLNPVLLRDLRLYMRGKLFLYGYFVTLVCLIVIAATGVVVTLNGQGLFSLLYPTIMLLAFATGALVPYLVGERFRDELSSHAAELILASPLTAARLVRGKVYGAWCLNLMLLSVAMPVFVTSYLLGGISPYALLFIFLALALAAAVMPLLNIYLGTFGRRPGVGRITSALVLVGSFIIMGMYGGALFDRVLGGLYGRSGLAFIVGYAVAGVLVAQFLYQVSVFRLRGPGLVREIRPRVSLAVAAALGWLGAFIVVSWPESGGADWFEANTVAFSTVAWAFAWGILVLARGNAASPSHRPGSGRSRHPLSSVGPGSLAMYCSVCTLVIVALGMSWLSQNRWPRDLMSFSVLGLVPLMAIEYGMAAYLLIHYRMRKTPGADSLTRTILVVNVLFGVLVFFLCTGLMFGGDVESLLGAVLAGTPVGLTYLSIAGNWYSLSSIILSGVAGTVILAFVNFVLGWRQWTRARGGDGA